MDGQSPDSADVETRITCSLAEALRFVVLTISPFLLLPIWLSNLSRSPTSWSETQITIAISLFCLVCGVSIACTFNVRQLGNGQQIKFQSGIPRSRTQFSRVLGFLSGVSQLALIVAVLVSSKQAPLSDADLLFGWSISFMWVAFSFCAIIRRIIEQITWILDMRAAQGHHITYEEHPMAEPFVVKPNWWK